MGEPIQLCERRADAECYVVRAHHEWGYFFIHEPSGSFSAITSFGNFAYIWSSIGTRTLKEFLQNLGYDYFFTKTDAPRRGMRWDKDGSVKAIKETIIDRRRKAYITRDQARDAWQAVEQIAEDTGGQPAEEGIFATRVYDDWDISTALRNDYEGITAQVRDPQCLGFWKTLWPVFLAEVRSPLPSDPCRLALAQEDEKK